MPNKPDKGGGSFSWSDRLRLPVIAAPMFTVSGPRLVAAAVRSGIVGALPAINAGDAAGLESWLDQIDGLLDGNRSAYDGALCVNLVMRDPRTATHIEVLARRPVDMVITSVGAPDAAIQALAGFGTMIFADVGSLHHAEKAIQAGVDGLVLLSAGAGGNSGWLNPFAFVRAVRSMFDGPIVLSGGMSDGHAIAAARVLDCDLVMAGTRFIAARESEASEAYRRMLVACTADDIMTTHAFSGVAANMLRPSIEAVGLDPGTIAGAVLNAEDASHVYQKSQQEGATRWRDIWSAGHSVSGVREIASVAEIVAAMEAEYRAALANMRERDIVSSVGRSAFRGGGFAQFA